METYELNKIVNFETYPVCNMLRLLLIDKTTKRNIIWATKSYEYLGDKYSEKKHLTEEAILGIDPVDLQPRVSKSLSQQEERTRKKAEVFTPSWICNKMNNHCDAEWFGREGVFNTEIEQNWIVNPETIHFDDKHTWNKYVDSKRLEITCGEAPYIVSRYDAATGERIPIYRRIGILDRKLRVVGENTDTEVDWLKWVIRAYQSVYGYEFQGDNLLIARINLLVTFVDYMQDKWNRVPTETELKKLTNIICWNLWQMDGLTGTIPYGKLAESQYQISLFDFVIDEMKSEDMAVDCRIFNWRSKESITYNSMKRGT
ncbi:hypothetical protein NXG27_06055 [Megasphaera paucivorans]|uniref:Restriction endonuclease subunit M n=1 Tax=Megasphaera paucivorans TaxID=349095 RepID=A0A1H0ABH0_9FIRM|nr:hypothetical protein [Megasphaera paucivorans]SDN30900.1 hypothetical protein SAMN05660299_02493 [Megasphaera paucivorans]